MGNRASAGENLARTEEASPEVEKRLRSWWSWVKKEEGKISASRVLRVSYVVLAVITILLSIGVIIASVTSAIYLKLLTSDQSGRVVGRIILAVVGAVALSISIYAVLAALKKKSKAVHAGSISLLVLAVIAAIVVGVSVPVSWEDEQHLSTSLRESFTVSMVDRNKADKWANIQSLLKCCGVNGASDYRMPGQPYLPPYVPISCCPDYDSGRSEVAQEKERLVCREQRKYHNLGCLAPVLARFKDMSHLILILSIVYIVFMVIQAVIGAIITQKRKPPLMPEAQVSNEAPQQPANPNGKAPAPKQKPKLSIS